MAVCKLCKTVLPNGENTVCGYCGYRNALLFEPEEGEEERLLSEHRKKVLGRITDLSVRTYTYEWDGDRLNNIGSSELRLGKDGIALYGHTEFFNAVFHQTGEFSQPFYLSCIGESGDVRQTVELSFPPSDAVGSVRLAVTINKTLHLEAFLFDTSGFSKAVSSAQAFLDLKQQET